MIQEGIRRSLSGLRRMRCTKCGTESKTSKKFCAECGSPLSSRCPKCAADNKPTSKFCEECGAALTGNVASAAASSPQAATTAANIRVTPAANSRVTPGQPDASTVLDGERKTVTALFADLKGSTALMEEMDPEEARAIIGPALRILLSENHPALIGATHQGDGDVSIAV